VEVFSGSNGARSRKRGPYAPEATRAGLLEVSLELFSARGFHATTVAAIAQRAKVTKGAFYHHFESKEDVLRQIHAEYANQMAAGAREVYQQDIAPIDKLRAIIERAVILLGRHRKHVAVFYQEYRFLSGEPYTAIRAMHDEEEVILLDVIAAAVRAGELRPDVNAKLLMFSISGVTAWIYQWYSETGPMPLEQIARQLSSYIVDGVAAPPGG
jgi:AcrR family transcriptional regulator